jgi:tetratricopeptide (TPR) repeat protein
MLERGDYDEAARVAEQGFALTARFSGTAARADVFRAQILRARQGRAARELHQLAEQVRLACGSEHLSRQGLQDLERCCSTIWHARAALLPAGVPQALPPETLRADLLDLAVLGADLRVRLGGTPEARQDALRLLDEAEKEFGAGPALLLEKQRHALSLGWTDLAAEAERRAQALPPRTAWEYQALGRCALQQGDLDRAEAAFRSALALDPRHYWSNYYQGLRALRQQDYVEAGASFGVCIEVEPGRAAAYYHRAQSAEPIDPVLATLDLDRALELEPSFAAAYLMRGDLHVRASRYDQAEADFLRSLEYGTDFATIQLRRARMALGRGDRLMAEQLARDILKNQPYHVEARRFLGEKNEQP